MGKIIRDRIPELAIENGDRIVCCVLGDAEFVEELDKKLAEEVGEFKSSPTLEELADILEVIYARAETMGYSREELEDARQSKAKTNGAFNKHLYMMKGDNNG